MQVFDDGIILCTLHMINMSVTFAFIILVEGGTHLTLEDFASHKSEWVDPVNTTYRDSYRVFEVEIQ